MKKYVFLSLLFFPVFLKSQVVNQIGFYSMNGARSIDSKSGMFVDGRGDFVDISDPANPTLLGSSLRSAASVFLEGNTVFFGDDYTGMMQIVDITSPSSPVVTGSVTFYYSYIVIQNLTLKDDILFMSTNHGLFSADVSNHYNPMVMDSIPDYMNGTVARSNYLYGASPLGGILVIDITDPSDMNVLDTIGSEPYIKLDIDTLNNRLFLTKSGGFDVYDISNPSLPVYLFSGTNSSTTTYDICYRNNMVYLALYAGLSVYKIGGNTATEMATFPSGGNGQTFAVAVQDSLILLQTLINGTLVLQYDSLGAPSGLKQQSQSAGVSFFPNPAKDVVGWRTEDFFVEELEVQSVYGTTVIKTAEENKSGQVDISALPDGNYILVFKGEQGTVHRKLLKIR